MDDTKHYNFTIESCLLAKDYKVVLTNSIITKNLRIAFLKTFKKYKAGAILITKALLNKDFYRLILHLK